MPCHKIKKEKDLAMSLDQEGDERPYHVTRGRDLAMSHSLDEEGERP